MKKGRKLNHLGRRREGRKALLKSLGISLIMHKRIFTTIAKAKALRRFIEPILTRAKKDDTSSRRLVFSYLQSNRAIKELFSEIGKNIINRPGGYCRIIRTGNRLGDNATTCLIELVDYNKDYKKSR